jgi:hypothetical protein
MKFKKGQWYQYENHFWQYDDNCFRHAGNEIPVKNLSYANKLTPASLTPDFSNAPEFGDCFHVIDGICKYRIDDNGVWIADGRYNLDGRYLNRDKHPALFNSFAQFMAYWQEEAFKMKRVFNVS